MSRRYAFLGLGLLACALGASPAPVPVMVIDDPAAKQPQVAVDGQGRIFVAFGVGREIRCAVSTDGGQSFHTPVSVGQLPTLALGMRRGPRIAATDRALIVTAIGGAQGMGKDGDVMAWRSTDLGQTWSGPERVNDVIASAREGLHALASRPDGTVFCAWLDLRNGAMEVFGARSTDSGETWEPDVPVYRSPDGAICPCCHPSVSFAPDGTLYVMWRNQLKGARDMYLARSRNGGQSFEPAEKLGQKSWIIDLCPMDGGAIAAGPRGAVSTSWMRAGQVFTAAPGRPERSLGPGAQIWTAPSPNGPISVWLERRPGRLLALASGGHDPTTLAESANDPVVASGPRDDAPVVAAWEVPSGDRRGIAVLVLSPAH